MRDIKTGYTVQTPSGGRAIVIRVYIQKPQQGELSSPMAKVQYQTTDRVHKIGDIALHQVTSLQIVDRGLCMPRLDTLSLG